MVAGIACVDLCTRQAQISQKSPPKLIVMDYCFDNGDFNCGKKASAGCQRVKKLSSACDHGKWKQLRNTVKDVPVFVTQVSVDLSLRHLGCAPV